MITLNPSLTLIEFDALNRSMEQHDKVYALLESNVQADELKLGITDHAIVYGKGLASRQFGRKRLPAKILYDDGSEQIANSWSDIKTGSKFKALPIKSDKLALHHTVRAKQPRLIGDWEPVRWHNKQFDEVFEPVIAAIYDGFATKSFESNLKPIKPSFRYNNDSSSGQVYYRMASKPTRELCETLLRYDFSENYVRQCFDATAPRIEYRYEGNRSYYELVFDYEVNESYYYYSDLAAAIAAALPENIDASVMVFGASCYTTVRFELHNKEAALGIKKFCESNLCLTPN